MDDKTMETLKSPSLESNTNSADSRAVMNSLLQGEGAAICDIGAGRTILLLHGGGGPGTVFGLAQALSANARVLLPTHPGFEGTSRPAHLDSASKLARLYLQLLEALNLNDVVVIGSSMGGWIAAEMALINHTRVKGVILINAVGIQVPGEQVADVSKLAPIEIAQLAHHNPQMVLSKMPTPTPERQAIQAANFAALAVYGNGASMADPGLRERLGDVLAPSLVLWGESDRIAGTAYGKAYADAFAHGQFERIAEAGHLPHIEQPARVLDRISSFVAGLDASALR
jgi:pimeloyl-ACP methyl ester carboxylesterase